MLWKQGEINLRAPSTHGETPEHGMLDFEPFLAVHLVQRTSNEARSQIRVGGKGTNDGRVTSRVILANAPPCLRTEITKNYGRGCCPFVARCWIP